MGKPFKRKESLKKTGSLRKRGNKKTFKKGKFNPGDTYKGKRDNPHGKDA